MQLKASEIINLYYEINGKTNVKADGSVDIVMHGLLRQKVSMKIKLYLHRLNTIVTEEFNNYASVEKELFKKYGKQQDDSDRFVIDKDNIEAFVKEQTELLSALKNIDVKGLWGTDLTIENLSSVETDEDYPIFLKLVDNGIKD